MHLALFRGGVIDRSLFAVTIQDTCNEWLRLVLKHYLILCKKIKRKLQRRGILRVFGPDRNGIVAAFSQLLNGHGCGIFSSEQSTDTATNMFFQRISFDYSSMHTDEITLESGIREVCERLEHEDGP